MLGRLSKALKEIWSIEVNGQTIWKPKGGDFDSAFNRVHEVATENENVWHDFVINLNNLVNEGWVHASFKKITTDLSLDPETRGTLGMIKLLIEAKEMHDLLPVIYTPLKNLNVSRSQGKAHGQWKSPNGAFIKDSKQIMENTVVALENIKVFSKKFNKPKFYHYRFIASGKNENAVQRHNY